MLFKDLRNKINYLGSLTSKRAKTTRKSIPQIWDGPILGPWADVSFSLDLRLRWASPLASFAFSLTMGEKRHFCQAEVMHKNLCLFSQPNSNKLGLCYKNRYVSLRNN